MAKEIERKFLIDTNKLPELNRGVPISQGYLSSHPTVRVRTYGSEAFLTVKGPGLIERDEFEYPIPWADAVTMLQMCSSRLSKVRYKIVHKGHIWEVDKFLDNLAPLWLAEIELTSIDEHVEIPDWITNEVSDRREYTNVSLSLAGKPPT